MIKRIITVSGDGVERLGRDQGSADTHVNSRRVLLVDACVRFTERQYPFIDFKAFTTRGWNRNTSLPPSYFPFRERKKNYTRLFIIWE